MKGSSCTSFSFSAKCPRSLKADGCFFIVTLRAWGHKPLLACVHTRTHTRARTHTHTHTHTHTLAYQIRESLTLSVPLSAIFCTSPPPQKAPAGTYSPWPPEARALPVRALCTSASARAVGDPIWKDPGDSSRRERWELELTIKSAI